MNNYIKALENSLKRDHTEMTHRSDLKQLLTNILQGYTITEEPGSKKGNKPDYEISKGKTPIGFIETKKVDYDLNKLEKDDQLKRYFESIGNVITTDYLEFRWYIKTENTNSYSNGRLIPQLTVRIADNISGKLRIKDNAEHNLKQLLKDFTETKVATVKKAKDLASRMSSIAKLIKDSILAELTADNDIFSNSTGENQLAKQLEFFKDNLITGLGEIEFADMYAQTICYGLFSAKIELGAKELLWESAWKVIPKTNPFLKKLFSEFTQELPESVTKPIDLAVHLLNKSDLESVLLDFGKGSSRDPVFHFYETFLGEYNPKLKEKRGVYYTPEPVVGFIVRSVNELLKDKFNMPEGLGDSSDTVVKRKTEDGKEEEYTTKRLHILDPATGTGTFLYHTLKQIFEERRIDKSNPKKTETLLERDILPRIHGFELMMAPYTIAHMKLGNLLHDVGYEGEQRLNIFLTNTLEKPHAMEERNLGGGFAQAIADESRNADKAKTELPVMVVLGNPPYSGHSANDSTRRIELKGGKYKLEKTLIGKLIEDYKKDCPELKKPAQAKWLQDDYVKFIRWAQWRIEQTGSGILAFITNHGYLDNPTFRGMRQSLLKAFSDIYIIDLHGNTKKKERTPDGGKDENVFDIQQGVAIGIFVKLPNKVNSAYAKVHHLDLYGLRETYKSKDKNALTGGKYYWLNTSSLNNIQDRNVFTPSKPSFLLCPIDDALYDEYGEYFSITDIPLFDKLIAPGVVTTQDQFAISFTKNESLSKIDIFLKTTNEIEAREIFKLCSQSQWNYEIAKKGLLETDYKSELTRILYRPFDVRFTIYDSNVAVHRRERVMQHMLGGNNLGLITVRRVPPSQYCRYFWITRNIISNGVIRSDNQSIDSLFPLYLYPTPSSKLDVDTNHWKPGKDGRVPNLSKKVVEMVANKLNAEFVTDGKGNITDCVNEQKTQKNITFGPEDILSYIYAIFHSLTYRTRYAQFLKMDFPRVPFTSNTTLFANLAILGDKLIKLHLLDSAKEEVQLLAPEKDYEISKISLEGNRVYINKSSYFEGVSEDVWNFQVGGYQPAHKWLKDRKGRELEYADMETYSKMIYALGETITLMKGIDETIENHGSYPLA